MKTKKKEKKKLSTLVVSLGVFILFIEINNAGQHNTAEHSTYALSFDIIA